MNRLVLSAIALLVVACTSGPTPSKRSTSTPTPSATPLAPDATPPPRRRSFGPDFAATPPGGTLVSIRGAILSHDRRTLTIDFLGTQPYTRADWCAEDYEAWAGIAGDELDVQVDTIKHPDQATAPPNGACTVDGYGYLYELHLPQAFSGSVVRDRGSGVLWVPPPEQVAELASIPDGWILYMVSGAMASDPEPHELGRQYGPGLGTPGDRNRYLFLGQVFGGPPDELGGPPIATVTIHGVSVPVARNGDIGYVASWAIQGGSLRLNTYDALMTLDDFAAMANGIAIPGS